MQREGINLRIGIVGCGAIAQLHAGAILATRGAELACLVDTDEGRARALATLFRSKCPVFTDYRAAINAVDGVVIALPHHLHSKVTLDFLDRGVHVLCEKPLAVSVAEATECVRRAAPHNVVLAVGMIRRFHPNTRLMRFLVSQGVLGALQRFEYVDGQAHAWPSATPFYFSRDLAGGGIFTTMGVHVIDHLLSCFDELRPVAYADDNFGGVEADSQAELRGLVGSEDIPGTVRCTNLYDLDNRFTIYGNEGSATIRGTDTIGVEMRKRTGGRELVWRVTDPEIPAEEPPDTLYFQSQIQDFADAMRGGHAPTADGETAVRVLRIIDECYGMAKRLDPEWARFAGSRMEVVA